MNLKCILFLLAMLTLEAILLYLFINLLLSLCTSFSISRTLFLQERMLCSLIKFLQALPKRLLVKDLGDLHYFLNAEVLSLLTDLLVTIFKYICDLLTKTHMMVKRCQRTNVKHSTTHSI